MLEFTVLPIDGPDPPMSTLRRHHTGKDQQRIKLPKLAQCGTLENRIAAREPSLLSTKHGDT